MWTESKMKLSVALLSMALCWALLIETGQSCSCPASAFQRTREAAIRDDFCFTSSVYTARVLGASCNCVAMDSTLRCYDYQLNSSMVSEELVAQGNCSVEGGTNLNHCANLSRILTVGGNDPGFGPGHTQCRNVCPFNNRSANIEHTGQPCYYTIQVVETFKTQNFAIAGTTLQVPGPDVLTSCGNPFRRLIINETYLVGVGHACSPISDWESVDNFSVAEINFLRQLSTSDLSVVCGAASLLPSFLTLLCAIGIYFALQL